MTSERFAEEIVGPYPDAVSSELLDSAPRLRSRGRRAVVSGEGLAQARHVARRAAAQDVADPHSPQRMLHPLPPGRREAPGVLPERVAAPPDADVTLHDALLRLPERLRTPLVLHYMEGYEVRQVASALRLPSGTVKSRMRKGRLMLKDLLSEEELS